MDEQRNSSNPQRLPAVRALLQTVQEPLVLLAEVLQAPDQLVADLTPTLDVVTFSPFAGLTVSTLEAQQPTPKPPLRSTGASPVATAMGAPASPSMLPPAALTSLPRLAPPVAAVNAPSSTIVTPVFALTSQKQTATFTASSPASTAAAPEQQLAPPTTSSPIAMVANTLAKAEPSAPLLDSGPSGLPVKPNGLPNDHVGDNQKMATVPPLTTMTVLATVVDSLLNTTPAAHLGPVARREPGMAEASSMAAPSVLSAGGNIQWPVGHEPAVHPSFATDQPVAASVGQSSLTLPPLNAPIPHFAGMLAEWPTAASENQPTHGVPFGTTTQLTNQPPLDPWTLSQLINDVLTEEARRHGVDLS
ncbi:MAG: hypothetical protein DYG89_20195 [Caldilinea sp. CFX5]|nr:hypothetical protein [Caldilinea sp. CFX5]